MLSQTFLIWLHTAPVANDERGDGAECALPSFGIGDQRPALANFLRAAQEVRGCKPKRVQKKRKGRKSSPTVPGSRKPH